VALVILAGGVVALVHGLNLADSWTETVAESVTGSYTEQTRYYLYGGIAAVVVGAGLLLTPGRRSES